LKIKKRRNFWGLLFIGYILILGTPLSDPKAMASDLGFIQVLPSALGNPEEPHHDENKDILIELFLSKDNKSNLVSIKKAFHKLSITRIRAQFYAAGKAPQIIAIGGDVPATVARLAIELAKKYNGGVQYLLPGFRFFPKHIAIGTSAFDEASQVSIEPEDLERLSDPSLTTEEFHSFYRSLTGEGQRQKNK